MLKHAGAVLLFCVVALPVASTAQKMDPDYAAHVKEWTTKPEFLSPLIDHLPASSGVPSPKDILGHDIGAPKQLTYYADVLRYYDALAAHTGRVRVLRIGKTEEGRDSIIVFVGSEDSIAHLDDYRANLAKLADPRGLTDEQAKDLIAKTKPIYTLSGGLHSAELGPPEMLMELAYRLATEDSPMIQKIRSEVVVAIMPVADPDGRDRSIDWYFAHNVDITDYQKMSGAPYWGEYTKHDDNRDINYAGLANQNFLRWFLQWHPQVIHDLHESVPFLYIYSGQAPQNPLWSPIVYSELPMLANWDMTQLERYGMPGVWTHAYVDAWSPGYVAQMATNHNALMRFYEIMGNGGATTMERTIVQHNPAIIGGGGPGGDYTKREWYRPNPPYKTVQWSMRDNTNYAETGVLSSLQFVSSVPQVMLEDFYTKGRDAITAGTKDEPYGYILPASQEDPTRVAFVIHILRMQGIEVGRAKSAIKLKDGEYPVGSLIVKTNQPYGPLAKTLLEKQTDPNPELTTYDDSAWTMSLMTHTEIKPSTDIAIQALAVDPVDKYEPEGIVKGAHDAAVYAVPDHGSPNLVTLRYGLKDVKIQIAEKPFEAAGTKFAAGTFLIPSSAGDTLKPLAEKLGLDIVGLAATPKVATHDGALPRLAIFSTWAGTQDVGWVRFTFDQYKVPYDLIFKERVLKGDLAKDYDLILIPTQARSAKSLVIDIPKSDKPLAYEKTDKFKFLGDYGSSPDISGGMGGTGVAEFEKFVEGGGTLVTLGASSSFPPDYGITPEIDTSNTGAKFYAPGPIVDADILQPENPIFYGYSDKTVPVRYANGPLFRMTEEMDKNDVLMRFPGGDKSVLSGLFNGADDIKGRAAIVVAPAGKGEVVMFATNPIWRWQNLGEYRMMFNTLMNYRNLTPKPEPTKPESVKPDSAKPTHSSEKKTTISTR
ncbi:M14 family zinc carboxypeptidase [Acidicapsa dinghuensis]|uniref:M14 family zinc carboxypeptidase n=1 Tax=Acidicapsa dinghuensis TaxID=2218256 RepID=A0ABW1EAI3_9BACT|nr:M14 family zinc carboxypeptidase [Acidicapsa dinghuensis]